MLSMRVLDRNMVDIFWDISYIIALMLQKQNECARASFINLILRITCYEVAALNDVDIFNSVFHTMNEI